MLASAVLQRLEQRLPLHDRPWTGSGRQAAVLVTLSDEAQPRVLLGRRAAHLPLHPGEMAFPGGKREAEDSGPWITAKREACEEVALSPEHVHPLGELPALVTRTEFEVHPCIARIPVDMAFKAAPEEFDALLQPPLELFAQAQRFRLETFRDGEHLRKVPHYDLDGEQVWGVTAAVLAQLVNLAYDAGLDLQRDWTQNA